MTQETYNRLFKDVINAGASGDLTLDEIGLMGMVFVTMARDLPGFVALVKDYEDDLNGK